MLIPVTSKLTKCALKIAFILLRIRGHEDGSNIFLFVLILHPYNVLSCLPNFLLSFFHPIVKNLSCLLLDFKYRNGV